MPGGAGPHGGSRNVLENIRIMTGELCSGPASGFVTSLS